jgi:hypothetical protein
LRNPCVNWGKAREFGVDFNSEVAIRQIGVEDVVIVDKVWHKGLLYKLTYMT